MCKWRTDSLEIPLCLSHQKLWIAVDKILPVVFLSIFHSKMFHKPCLNFKVSWGINFPPLIRGKDTAQDMWDIIPAFRGVMGIPGKRAQQQPQELTDT